MVWPPEDRDIVLVNRPMVHSEQFPEWRPPQRFPTHPVRFPSIPQPTGADSLLHDEHQRRLQHLGGLDPMRPADLVNPPPPPPAGLNSLQFSEMIKMAEKCFTSYDEYESARGRAYSHMNLPAPQISIPPVVTTEMANVSYYVCLTVPGCGQCHKQFTMLRHKAYLELYPQLPLSVSMVRG